MTKIRIIVTAAILLFMLVPGCAPPKSETRTFYEVDPANGKSVKGSCSYGGFKTASIREFLGKKEINWSGFNVKPSPSAPNPDLSTHLIIQIPNTVDFRLIPERVVVDVDGRRFRPSNTEYTIEKYAKGTVHRLSLKYRLKTGKNERLSLIFEDRAALVDGQAWPIAPFRATLVTKTAAVSYMLNC
jgi:hypothetical protein